MSEQQASKQATPTLVFSMGILLFFLGAMGFFSNLQWVLLSFQRSLPDDTLTRDLARHLELLLLLEQQIPFFNFWVYYGLIFHSMVVFAAYGVLRFNNSARQLMRVLLGEDALAFLALVIYYQATGYVPRIVERFHMRFIVAASRIVFLIYLGSPAFMKSFGTRGRHRTQPDNPST